MTTYGEFRAQIKLDWDIKGIVHALRSSGWRKTDSHWFNRFVFIAGDSVFTSAVQNSVPEEEWSEAEEMGRTYEIENKYAEAFADLLSEAMGEDVYLTGTVFGIIPGGWFAGQSVKASDAGGE